MQEKRQYVRMKTVFPVEFTVLDERGEKSSGHLLQGFTRDVSAGGLCVELKSFAKETEADFSRPKAALSLSIDPPFAHHPIEALGIVAWFKKTGPAYTLGVSYTQIDPKARRRIIRYAKNLIWAPRVVVIFGFILLAVAAGLFFNEGKLLRENKQLVNELIKSAEKRSDVTSKLVEIQNAKFKLSADLAAAHQTITSLELEKQKDLAERLKNIESGQARLESTYRDMEKSESGTSLAALRQMYGWLKTHRNLKTGLVASFEGDPSLENVAFTYDLMLACQTFLLFGDTEEARTILSFYDTKARMEEGGYFSAYSIVDGQMAESLVQTGPNVWVGITALQYQARVKDKRFVGLATRIGDWLIIRQDSEGGLQGTAHSNWYSTEHHLDAYAFFGMLYQTTGDVKYQEAQDKVFAWIRKYAYSITEKRMLRGKGDATIATDTFSWAVSAIGPETLKKFDFDPEAIMEYAEEQCKVTVSYTQPDGKISRATGFDFAKAQNVGRGGIISCEWTAQAIVSYQVLGRYFAAAGNGEKARFYGDKAGYYLSELQKLIITSPSKIGQGRGCLPYASADNADTGHGWRTPKGTRTGSVSATAYGIFAWTGFNPFDLKHEVDIEKSGPESA